MRALWLAVAVIAAALVGAAAALLSWASGDAVPRAMLVGGSVFGGTLLLALTTINFVADHGPS
ncbi:hypothetical protein RB614_28305 [Phytohabitans sp. ZYX-F-186]|uniref:Major facilitator superfamily (MFS) profile domain-containing protein n=1 Tax=Phytohabitans maris TaxID=3071409 RepID=A0ABU0ZR73_9ACTN|nr:hypothetical protein [Phytohabitans sp. ZYX-F-186]MDQ7908437.1 hypothetical protein [Phytohabitans sp. ZYX-F-186]